MDEFTPLSPSDSGRQHAVVSIAWWIMEELFKQFPRSLAKEFPGYTKVAGFIEKTRPDTQKKHISAGLMRTLDLVEELDKKYCKDTDDPKELEKNWRILWWAGATLWLDATYACPLWAKSPAWRQLRDRIVNWMDRQVRLRGDDEGEIGTWDIYMPIMYAIKGIPLSVLKKYR